MVTLEKAIIARINKEGKHFEILVDPDLAYDLKSGKSVSIQNMLAVNAVFTDSKKGLRASPSELERIFGTQDIEVIAEKIVKEGEIQITTQFRNEKIEEKKRQIAAFISKNAINPQTNLPHPIERILNAMEKCGVDIDPFKPVSQQIDHVIKILKQEIPLSFEQIKLNIHIPAKYAGQAYGILKQYNMENDQWLNDGSLRATITIPAGLKEEVFHRLGALTEGNVDIQEVKNHG